MIALSLSQTCRTASEATFITMIAAFRAGRFVLIGF